ncbi:MAG: acyl-CoA thioesterase [Pseudonocardiales bacterium]|nr:acyl-CoA thioesterase [Pseudonocardiales bacterium]
MDDLLGLLDLTQLDENVYSGVSPAVSLPFVFGGQVAAQSLAAAGRTVGATHSAHSMHAYFVRSGDPSLPITFKVDRVRDGRSFSVRRVEAIQHDKAIFVLSASFQTEQSGLEQTVTMPTVPDPLSLPTLFERTRGYPEMAALERLPQPFDVRYVSDPPWQQQLRGATTEPQRLWMRAAAPLPDDSLTHFCSATFSSDMTLLETVLLRQGLSFDMDGVKGASLDHSMWFHRPFRVDEWFLYETESVAASGGRGLAGGRMFSAGGRHVITVMQEGMLRAPLS